MAEKNPLDILRKEHDKVLVLLDRLEKEIENKADIKKDLIALEKEFEKHSLNKEEKVLFPELEKFMPREGGPTGMMISEHKDLSSSIKNLKDALKQGKERIEEIGNHI